MDMNVPNKVQKCAIFWVISVSVLLSIFIFFTRLSYFEMDAIMIWIFSCAMVLYQSRSKINYLSSTQRKITIGLGIFICIFSFLNIPLGFGNSPFSIGDFSILLSGLGIFVFGYLGIETFLVAVSIPFIAVIGFQLYGLFLVNEQVLSAPLLPYTVFFSTNLFKIVGIPVVTNNNLISFVSHTGDMITLSITPECTGIWSLGTFTIIALFILFSFREAVSLQGFFLLLIGYLGTYTGNIIRIVAIGYSGFLYGPTGAIENTHLYFGWIIFTIWMIIFWYYYFTRVLKINVFHNKSTKSE
jgi:exosortase/archaeosortase family protein